MTNWTHLFFQEVLDKNRLNLLPKLLFFKEKWYYLAWGTALALIYWHRESVDFDFFINENIDTNKLFEEILEKFKNEKIIKTYEENNTLYIEINNIKISFMTYKYNLLQKLINTEYLNILSDLDISAMKLWAIQNRATNKDYVDLYYILKKYSINEVISAFYSKFWKVISENLILKSLVYFDDIEEQELIIHDDINFYDVKNNLEKLVKNND